MGKNFSKIKEKEVKKMEEDLDLSDSIVITDDSDDED